MVFHRNGDRLLAIVSIAHVAIPAVNAVIEPAIPAFAAPELSSPPPNSVLAIKSGITLLHITRLSRPAFTNRRGVSLFMNTNPIDAITAVAALVTFSTVPPNPSPANPIPAPTIHDERSMSEGLSIPVAAKFTPSLFIANGIAPTAAAVFPVTTKAVLIPVVTDPICDPVIAANAAPTTAATAARISSCTKSLVNFKSCIPILSTLDKTELGSNFFPHREQVCLNDRSNPLTT